MKKFCVVMSILFLGLLVAVPASMAKKPVKIRFSHVVSENTPKGWAANEFAARVNRSFLILSFTTTTRRLKRFPPDS